MGIEEQAHLRLSVRIKLDFVYKVPGFAGNQLVALTTPTRCLSLV